MWYNQQRLRYDNVYTPSTGNKLQTVIGFDNTSSHGLRQQTISDVALSGDYNDLSNKPTIPTVPTDVSAFNNDAGYITKAYRTVNYTDTFSTIDELEAFLIDNFEKIKEIRIHTFITKSGVTKYTFDSTTPGWTTSTVNIKIGYNKSYRTFNGPQYDDWSTITLTPKNKMHFELPTVPEGTDTFHWGTDNKLYRGDTEWTNDAPSGASSDNKDFFSTSEANGTWDAVTFDLDVVDVNDSNNDISDTPFTLTILRKAYRNILGSSMLFKRQITVQGQRMIADGGYYICDDLEVTSDFNSALIENQNGNDSIYIDLYT